MQRLTPDNWVTLVATVGGTVEQVAVVEGDLVTAGSLLLRLSDGTLKKIVAGDVTLRA